jgi:hypothetical protein
MATYRDECAVAAVGTARATLDEIARLRKDPGPRCGRCLDLQCLRHADEQTVVGMAALLRALATLPVATPLTGWGVVAAPRWPGRVGTVRALDKYQADGPRSASALIIPNLCLHSMSGSLSLALGMTGPNFGIGGGLANVADGLLGGLLIQLEQDLPGTWVVLSAWEVEPTPEGNPISPSVANAVALALVPPEAWAASAWRLRLEPAACPGKQSAPAPLTVLCDYLAAPSGPREPWSCSLDWGMELVLQAA